MVMMKLGGSAALTRRLRLEVMGLRVAARRLSGERLVRFWVCSAPT